MKSFMMFLAIIFFICSLSIIFPGYCRDANATQVTVSLEDLGQTTRNYLMTDLADLKEKAEKKAAEAAAAAKDVATTTKETAAVITEKLSNADPEKFSKWSKSLAVAVKDVCHELNIEVNEFAKTPVGLGIIGIIAYKYLGADFLSAFRTIFFTLAWAFVVGGFVIISFFYFHVPKKVKSKEKVSLKGKGSAVTYGEPKYVQRYEWKGNDAKICSAWMHGAALLIVAVTSIALLV